MNDNNQIFLGQIRKSRSGDLLLVVERPGTVANTVQLLSSSFYYFFNLYESEYLQMPIVDDYNLFLHDLEIAQIKFGQRDPYTLKTKNDPK